MNENDFLTVAVAAWTTVQVTRLALTYRAGQRKADRDTTKNAPKETTNG